MKIFICWSRGRSKALAEALHVWLPRVIDGVDPFLSSEIEKGRRWLEELLKALRESQIGLVCLTPECLGAPWIHFEAGALASAMEGRLYTYFHGVKPEEFTGPLSAFQSTRATRDDTLLLVTSLAREAGGVDPDLAQLEARFDKEWPSLAAKIRMLDEVMVETAVPGFADLFKSKTFTEPMRECPDLGWIARHERLARVDAVLERARYQVIALGLPHVVRLYDELRRELDLYLMNVRSKLLTARSFEPALDGLLDIPKDVLDGCETPRLRVAQLVQRLLDSTSAPIMDEAIQFDGLDFDQKKARVQHIERRIEAGKTAMMVEERSRALGSFWDLDRIVCYLSLEAEVTRGAQVVDLSHHVRRELELVEAKRIRFSLMPLYYSVRALDRGLERSPVVEDELRQRLLEVVADVERYMKADPARDKRGKFAERFARIRERLATDPACSGSRGPLAS
jgi:TIR domain-containing protein